MTDSMRSVTIEIPTTAAHRITESFEGTIEDATRSGLQLLNGMGPTAYNNLQELAKQLDTTPAKALRSAIQRLAEECARLSLTKSTAGRPKINSQRDAELYARIKAGATHAEVASEFSLSMVRVGQIVALQRHAAGDAPRRGRGSVPNPRKSHGQPNLMRMYDELDAGVSIAVAAQVYGMDEQRVRDLYATYKTNLPANPTVSDKANATIAATQEPLTLKDSDTPTPPRKLAVIPPSMRNPELFAEAKPIKIPDPATVDVSMFADDNPDFAI